MCGILAAPEGFAFSVAALGEVVVAPRSVYADISITGGASHMTSVITRVNRYLADLEVGYIRIPAFGPALDFGVAAQLGPGAIGIAKHKS